MNQSQYSFKNKIAPIAGIFACLTLYSSIAISAYSFKGLQGQSFSLLNHFISDLGNFNLSSNFNLFNAGVVLAGIGFGVFAYGCDGLIHSKLAKASVVIAIIASVLLMGVGLVPTTAGPLHLIIALSFFILMTLGLALYSLCIWQTSNSPFPKSSALYGLLSPISLFIFMLMPKDLLALEEEQGALFDRPDFWGLAFSEWTVFFFLTSWVLVISYQMLRSGVLKNPS